MGEICICDMRIFYMPNLSSAAANTAVSPRSSPQGTLYQCAINRRTYKFGGGGREGRLPPASEVFLIFFLDGKTSAPDVFSSCLFIPRAHFETILVMVSHYGYEIWRLSSKWSSHFWVKMNVFSTFFNNKSTTCGWNDTKCLFMCYFTYQVQQITIYLGFNLISNFW